MRPLIKYCIAHLWLATIIALPSCMPCPKCGTPQCSPPLTSVTYNKSHLSRLAGYTSNPHTIPLTQKRLHEISGLAASNRYHNLLYLHEDNGHSNRLYLTNHKGEDLGKLTVNNSRNHDWEDIAVGPGPSPKKYYVYIADIGNNHKSRCKIRIYRFPEPPLKINNTPINKTIKGVKTITLQYPDKSHNAETILIDPLTKDLFIVSKDDDSCRLYVAAYPQSVNHKIILKPLLTLPFSLITAGDISRNGLEIFLRDESYYWHWNRRPGETVMSALQRPPAQIIPVTDEPQGEAICFAANNKGFYTCSEVKKKQQPVIYFYSRK